MPTGRIAGISGKLVSLRILRQAAAVVDLAIVLASGFFMYTIYLDSGIGIEWRYFDAVTTAVVLSFLVFNLFDCYSEKQVFSRIPRVGRITVAWMTVICILMALSFFFKISELFSRVWAVGWFGMVFFLMAVHRILLSFAVVRLADLGFMSQRSVIIGAGEIGQRLAAFLDRQPHSPIRIIGFIEERQTRLPPNTTSYPILGSIDALFALVREGKVDQVLVALPWHAEDRLKSILERVSVLPVDVKLAPDLITFHFPNRPLSLVNGLPMINVFDRPISGWASISKTIEDRILSLLFLILVLPLFVAIAVAIKLDSPGPVFFVQQRYGFNNKLIKVLKFRTMYHHMRDANAEKLATRNDPRVTAVGRFLRRTSLDELPQLINVLKGDMSIVGPRPHAISAKAADLLYEEVVNNYMARHKVKPGITGWAQVNGWRGETDTTEKLRARVEHDLYYIENWSVFLDLWIILKTVVTPFQGQNAY